MIEGTSICPRLPLLLGLRVYKAGAQYLDLRTKVQSAHVPEAIRGAQSHQAASYHTLPLYGKTFGAYENGS